MSGDSVTNRICLSDLIIAAQRYHTKQDVPMSHLRLLQILSIHVILLRYLIT